MADSIEAKQLKQYLIDTKAFHSLAKIFSLLRTTDPKPMDPIQFVRDQLGGSTFDIEDYRALKQNVAQLNEDVSQIKTEIAKISSALTKLTDSNGTRTDATVICNHDSNQSMENNVGDSNHASLLNDSDFFNDTANQTIINASANGLPTEKLHNKINGDEYTLEFIEVDVVCQANDSSQSISDSVSYASLAETSMNGNGDFLFGDFGEFQGDGGGDEQISSPEPITVANGVSHAVIKDVQINDTETASIECQVASSPEKPPADTNVNDVDMNTEDSPIIDDSKDQQCLSQSFSGFGEHDGKQSKKRLSEISEMVMQFPLPNNVDGHNEQTDNAEMIQSDERKLIVEEIVDEAVEIIIQEQHDKVHAGNELNVEATTAVINQFGIESTAMPKDDPETAFFLSLS